MNKIAAIVVTYNRKELLKECIQSLLNQSMKEFDIFIIDNNSNDGTKEYINNYINDGLITYFNTNANLGGAGGFNYGLKEAMKLPYDYFWLMDDDSIPHVNALLNLYNASKKINDDYGFLCSNVKWIDGKPCKMNIPEIDSDWLEQDDKIYLNLIKVVRATFVGFFVRRKVIEKVGYPIKEFFIWSDDSNYSLRINQYYSSYCVIDSLIIHKMKSNDSASIITDNSGRCQRYFYAYRNRYYNSRMIHKKGKYFLEIFTTTIHIINRSQYKMKKLFYMYKGVFAGVFFKPSIEYVEDRR